MSDQGPTDPTRPVPAAGGPRGTDPATGPDAGDGTSVLRTTTDPADPRPDRIPTQPPRSGGVSTGVAIGAALAIGLLGLLIGFFLFNDNEDPDPVGGLSDDATLDDETAGDQVPDEGTADTVPDDERAAADLRAELDEVTRERDELAQQVDDLEGEVTDLQSALDAVTEERDELQARLDAAGEQLETAPAPDVVGNSVDAARQIADANGWTLVEQEAQDPPADAEPGTVVEQQPAPGTPMSEGSALVVEVVPETDQGG